MTSNSTKPTSDSLASILFKYSISTRKLKGLGPKKSKQELATEITNKLFTNQSNSKLSPDDRIFLLNYFYPLIEQELGGKK